MCTPLVIDSNPALPNMSTIINRHKYILNLDKKLHSVIPSESIFVSCRGAKTIKDILIHSKLPSDESNNTHSINNDLLGCFKCNKCYLCRHYLSETKTFTSFHTTQIFQIKDTLTCDSKCLIYLIDCLKHKTSYVGYCTTNIKARFSNNKSHIKKNICSCEIVKHIINVDHQLDHSSLKNYDESLSKSIRVTLIEKVDIQEGDSVEERDRKCESREGYWMTQLRTLQRFGGLNKKDSRRYETTRQSSQMDYQGL